MFGNPHSRARSGALVAGLVLCLLLVQAHALLHTHRNLDCKVCTSSLWMAPSAAPAIENPAPTSWTDRSPRDRYFPEHEFRQTTPRAPPIV